MASEAEQSNHEGPPSIVHGPALPVPLTMAFGDLLDYHVEARGDQPAVISHPQGLTVSWRQLSERSIKMARALAEDGVGKGSLVAISLGSRTEYFETFFACAKLGAALVMLNYAYAESEMLALLKVVCECNHYNARNINELSTDRIRQVQRFSSRLQASYTTTTPRFSRR
jgi:acyl-CoA synthetase (AMP-forming)/AMP-acid ligase II